MPGKTFEKNKLTTTKATNKGTHWFCITPDFCFSISQSYICLYRHLLLDSARLRLELLDVPETGRGQNLQNTQQERQLKENHTKPGSGE